MYYFIIDEKGLPIPVASIGNANTAAVNTNDLILRTGCTYCAEYRKQK